MDRQEIGRIVQLADQIELVTQGPAHRVGQTLGIAIRSAGPGQLFEGLLRRHARRRDLVGILIGQFVEREAAPVGDLDRAGQSLGIGLEQAVHLGGRLQMSVRMAFAPKPQFVDGAAVTHAGDDILQQSLVRMMEEDVIGRHGRHAGLGRQGGQVVQAQRIAGAAPQRQGQIGAGRKGRVELTQPGGAGVVGLVGDEDGDQVLRPVLQVGPVEMASGLAGAALAQGQQAGEAGIGGAVGRIDQQAGPINQVEAAADDQAHA